MTLTFHVARVSNRHMLCNNSWYSIISCGIENGQMERIKNDNIDLYQQIRATKMCIEPARGCCRFFGKQVFGVGRLAMLAWTLMMACAACRHSWIQNSPRISFFLASVLRKQNFCWTNWHGRSGAATECAKKGKIQT